MKKNRKYGTAVCTPPNLRQRGTPILGRVIPELAVCGVFDLKDSDVSFIAKGITTAILAQFQVDLLQASGLIGKAEEDI
jgi:hypothetical protein